MLQGINEIDVTIACDSPEAAGALAAEIGEPAIIIETLVRVCVYSEEAPSAAAISSLARFAAKRMATAVDGLATVLATPQQ